MRRRQPAPYSFIGTRYRQVVDVAHAQRFKRDACPRNADRSEKVHCRLNFGSLCCTRPILARRKVKDAIIIVAASGACLCKTSSPMPGQCHALQPRTIHHRLPLVPWTRSGPRRREQVRVNLERLLSNKDFVEEYCGDDAPRGLKVLYEDRELGFQILAHVNEKVRDIAAA